MIITGKMLVYRKGEVKEDLKIGQLPDMKKIREIVRIMDYIVEYSDNKIEFVKNRYLIDEVDFDTLRTAIKMNEAIR